MNRKCLLEISVASLEGAMAAERGGADRIELCADLSIGGVTPDVELLRAARAKLHIPIFSMVRPRAGDFVYSNAEFAEMKSAVSLAKEFGMDGVVLGMLRKDRLVDIEQTRELVELARPLPATYHRAFDEAADLRRALEDIIKTGARRILTAGGAQRALEGATALAELVVAAGDRIAIVPGAGINASNISVVAKQTGAREFHSGLSSALPYGSRDYRQFETEVQKLADSLRSPG
jgi:copper homeostasis protein